MLLEIMGQVRDKDMVMCQVWQTFGILLEYCARGDFLSTVNTMKSRNDSDIEELNKIIAEKTDSLEIIQQAEQSMINKFEDSIKNLSMKNVSQIRKIMITPSLQLIFYLLRISCS